MLEEADEAWHAADVAEVESSAASHSSSDTEADDADVEVLEEDIGEELLLVPLAISPPPQQSEERKSSKQVDPVGMAQRRVRLKLREEVRAARKARRKERAKAKKRKGVGINLDDFLSRTRERLERHQAEVHATELQSALATESTDMARRGRGISIEEFTAKTQMRLHSRIKAAQAAFASDEAKRAARAREIEASGDLVAFQRDTQARIMQRLFSSAPETHGRRRRIGIVGAGPVGLWAAFLIARKYVGDHRRRKRSDAPQVTVLESRPAEAHGLRHDVRIALSSNTQKLLNLRTKSSSFVSGMAVAEIEAELQGRWRLAAKASVEFGVDIQDPAKLCKERGFDCILWAAGRRSLDEPLRASLGCEQQIGDSDQVLVFQLGKLGTDPWQHGGDLTGPVQQAAGIPTLRTMLRPGLGGQCSCWLWLFGLPKDSKTTAFNHASTKAMQQSIPDAVAATIAANNPYLDSFQRAAVYLQSRLKPESASLRWVEASFWSSARSVVDLGCLDEEVAGVPLVLLGDAGSGKPFYTGTTLNKHLWDVDALIGEVKWCCGSLLDGLEAHERRYQAEIRRLPAFRRPPS